MAVLQKKGDSKPVLGNPSLDKQHADRKGKNDKDKNNWSKKVCNWLDGDFSFIDDKDFIRAIPTRWADIYNNVKGKLHVIHAGVGIGTVKGKDIIPDVSLALSTALNKDAFPMAELSYDDAINYLRKEAITLDSSVPRGFTIVTYKSHPLGFVKNLGNRANNLYPQEWRIMSTHIPEDFASPLLPEGLGEALGLGEASV